jgi:hypothetical protein
VAEIKQAHKQFAGHMTKIIRELSYTSDSIVACVTGQCGQLCKKHSLNFSTNGFTSGLYRG